MNIVSSPYDFLLSLFISLITCLLIKNDEYNSSYSSRVHFPRQLLLKSSVFWNTISIFSHGKKSHWPQFSFSPRCSQLFKPCVQVFCLLQPVHLISSGLTTLSRNPVRYHNSETLSSAAISPAIVALNRGHSEHTSPQIEIFLFISNYLTRIEII
jgi:hypothetical protein